MEPGHRRRRLGTLTWIKLGSATSAEIKALADKLKAADIMDVKTTDPADASYTKIPFSGKTNWVKSSRAWRRPPPSWKPTATPP
jgi:hypothetical protein